MRMVKQKNTFKKVSLIAEEDFTDKNILEKPSTEENFEWDFWSLHKSLSENRNNISIKTNFYKSVINGGLDIFIYIIYNKISNLFSEIEEQKLVKNLHINKRHYSNRRYSRIS